MNSAAHPRERGGRRGTAWLYLLILVPLVTELLEGGELSRAPRVSVTEVVMTLLLALSVLIINRQATRLARAAMTDPLTKLGNRRALTQQVERELTRSRRLGHPLSLVFIDLDRFKAINDRLGHQQGDRTLRAMAEIMTREGRRDVDSSYRVGGDEFVMICPGADLSAAREIVRRVRDRARPLFKALGVNDADISVGTAERRHEDSGEDLLWRADVAMYRDKAAKTREPSRRPAGGLFESSTAGGDASSLDTDLWLSGQRSSHR